MEISRADWKQNPKVEGPQIDKCKGMFRVFRPVLINWLRLSIEVKSNVSDYWLPKTNLMTYGVELQFSLNWRKSNFEWNENLRLLFQQFLVKE